MAGCAGRGWWPRAAALYCPPSSAWSRCTDGIDNVGNGSDPLALQLSAVLSSTDPAGVTARILTRLRDGGLLSPDPFRPGLLAPGLLPLDLLAPDPFRPGLLPPDAVEMP